MLAGTFLALAVGGASLVGPVGTALGALLRRLFGVGAALLPVPLVFWSVVLFGHADRAVGRRVMVLFLGLALTVPFTLGVAVDARPPDVPWTVGLVGGFLAFELRPFGPLGEGLLAVGAFSALTLVTVGWNPLGILKKREAAGGRKGLARGGDERSGAPEVGAEPVESVISEMMPEGDLDLQAAWSDRPPAHRRRAMPARTLPPELPSLDLLDPVAAPSASFEADLDRLGEVLIRTLQEFKVEGRVVGRTTGPVVTQFEVEPAAGVKVGRIAALADDLALAMRAQSVRIVAPIPGKGAVGVEVPNPSARLVTVRELLEAPEWRRARADLPIALGRDLEGRAIVADLARMPHLLIAGTTGSGKSVCINTIVSSLLYRYTSAELRLLMIDPKMVELSMYNALPHLRHPVVTDNRDAAQVLKWAVWEMQDRYELFHANGVRNVVDFNRKVAEGERSLAPLPYVVVVVDELADLMMTVQGEVETPLAQLAQKARAVGIHLILATQRPSVNVITGLIKANFPSRIAFRVASKIDSRTILDQNGAEALLGNGDMLFMQPGKSDLLRLQGGYVATGETERLMHWFDARKAEQLAATEVVAGAGPAGPAGAEGAAFAEPDILEIARERAAREEGSAEAVAEVPGERDRLFRQAAEVCIQHQLGSTSLLQRRLKIGYGRAARIIDQLHEAGVLGPPDGSKAREVMMGLEELGRMGG